MIRFLGNSKTLSSVSLGVNGDGKKERKKEGKKSLFVNDEPY